MSSVVISGRQSGRCAAQRAARQVLAYSMPVRIRPRVRIFISGWFWCSHASFAGNGVGRSIEGAYWAWRSANKLGAA